MTVEETWNEFIELAKVSGNYVYRYNSRWRRENPDDPNVNDMKVRNEEFLVELYKCHIQNQQNGLLTMLIKNR